FLCPLWLAARADPASPAPPSPPRRPPEGAQSYLRPPSWGPEVTFAPPPPRQHMLTKLPCQLMLTGMETTLEIAEGAASNDPEVGLRAVAALRSLTER